MNLPVDAKTITLRDGRKLGYAEYGQPKGLVVLWFHPMPGSRCLMNHVASAAERLGIRLINVERPGYGVSDFQPGRRILDWPDDVAQLTNALSTSK